MNTVKFIGVISLIVSLIAPAQSQELKKVRVGIPTLSLIVASSLIPGERGYFRQEGLDVELIVIRSAPSVLALTAKEIDFLTIGGGGLIGILRGLPLRVAFAPLRRPTYALYAKPEIRSLADLKAKVLAVTVPGATTDFAARVLLQQVGLTPGKDVKILYLKGMPEILAGITQGNADAGIFTSPTTLKARQAGLKELVNVTEQNIPMIHAAFASTKDYLKTQPDNVRRFLQGYLEGIKVARADPELAKQMIGKYTKTTDRDDLEDSYRTFLPAWEKLPVVPTAAVQTMLNFATHPAAKTAKAENFIDNSALLELERSGFVDRLYK